MLTLSPPPFTPRASAGLGCVLPWLQSCLYLGPTTPSRDLSSYALILCLFGVFTFLGKYVTNCIEWAQSNLTSTVHVSYSNETHDMLLAWMSTHDIGNSSRSSIARVGSGRRSSNDQDAAKKKPLHFSPWKGNFFFQYKYSVILFRSTLKETQFRQEEEISLSCLGRSQRIIRELLDECRDEYLQQTQKKITVFEHREGYWSRAASVVARPTPFWLIGPGNGTRAGHSRTGEATCFMGHQGPENQASAFAMAGRFDLDIYVVDITTVDNNSLSSLFSALPPKCVVLVEDVDAAGATGRRDTKKTSGGSHKGVTLSSLLNALDGVASQEGRILIMTTNHIEKLDKALMRPGRIDKTVRFRLADADVLKQLFCLVFKQTTEEVEDPVWRNIINTQIERQASEFVTRIPHGRLSPAEVLSFLLQYRDCPRAPGRALTDAKRFENNKPIPQQGHTPVGKQEL
ncbi:hypothetical protein DL764_010033 [Monosporascus ibericus]|uniref:BCS1 N-terminal domain-containing protein n=1 Tax=Monosporascus ibericus TaxID=155417 RepID=A0A4Q4SWA0_9PEZI|nr:hypothetical protein DL764_010033 [Monosporascus ibericus]